MTKPKEPDKKFVVKIYSDGGRVSQGLFVEEDSAIEAASSAKSLAELGVTSAYQIRVYDIANEHYIYVWDKPIFINRCF